MAAMQPYNIKPVPVDIDGQGMRSDALRTILTEWDAEARGMPRYTWLIVPHIVG
jgi:aromatic amino acid aminotransferase I